MYHVRALILFLTVILGCCNLLCQEIVHYTTSDGLSGTDVTAICADENYLWIATNDGLNRFDGKAFKVYRSNKADANSLAENSIETLMIDSRGLMWIGFKTGGVDIFDTRKNTFTHLKDILDTYPQRVMTIFEDSNRHMWLGSWEDGLYQIIPSSDDNGGYKILHHYKTTTVSSILEKPEGKLWIGTYYGYFVYDLEHKCDIPTKSTPYAVTQLLDTGDKNSLWMSTWNDGLQKITWNDDFTDFNTIPTQYAHNDFYRIYPHDVNTLYLASWGGGIKIFDKNGLGQLGETPIDAQVAMSFFRDKYNKLWVGTYGMGLYSADENGRGISEVFLPDERKAAAYALTTTGNGDILIGTQGDGVYLYDTNMCTISRQKSEVAEFFQRYILCLYRDENVTVIGNDDEGIKYIPAKNPGGTSATTKILNIGKNFGKITVVFRDDNNLYWFGTKQSGLFSAEYDTDRHNFVNCMHHNVIGANEITGIDQSFDGKILIASHGGVYRFDATNHKVRSIDGIHEMVYSMVDDSRNKKLWIGTSEGLKSVDYSTETDVVEPMFQDMLPGECVREIITDFNNNMWFTMGNRIYCYTTDTQELKEINLKNQSPRIIYSATLLSKNGKQYVVFGCDDRLLFIDPKEALHRPNHTKILLTGIQINHHSVDVGEAIHGCIALTEAPEYTETINLSYLCKWIDLSFTEVGWDNFRNNYQYYIKGLSEEWHFLDLTKPLSFSQLAPGAYTLMVRQVSQRNSESDDDILLSLNIVVSPPIWQTTWFYVLVTVLIILILILLVWLIKRHFKRLQAKKVAAIEKHKKEEILQEKENFFTELSHDLLTSFSLILAPTVDLLRDNSTTEGQKEKLNIIFKNAEILSDTFKSILDYRRAEIAVGSVSLRTVDIVAYIKMTVDAFRYLAKAANIELNWSSSTMQLVVSVDIEKLERVLYNILGNAIKYTREGGSVEVRFDFNESTEIATVIVTDTGVGIKDFNKERVFDKFYRGDNIGTSPGLGLGLYTSGKFISAMKGNISMDSVENIGTTVRIEFPVERIDEPGKNGQDSASDSGRFNLLLVEDNEQMQKYLNAKFSEHFDVSIASNGEEALELIKSNLPELVLSDVMMPHMDGLELCRRVKMNPMYADIFFILLSAKSSVEDEIEGYKAGADLYLKKPFDPDVLITQMKNLYTTRRQRRKQIISEILESNDENITSPDTQNDFIGNALAIVERNIMKEDFKIDEFAAEMNLSKAVLNRKFKNLVGETPSLFIRNIRLRKAAKMLRTTDYSISEIAYMTGFGQVHYFIKRFKELYGDTPKNYRNSFTSDDKSDENEIQ